MRRRLIMTAALGLLNLTAAGAESLRLDFSRSPLEQLGQSAVTGAAGEQPWRLAAGGGIRLTVERPYARPGERWIETVLEVNPQMALGKTRVRARLYRLGCERAVDELTVVPGQGVGALGVDLRREGLKEARLSVELLHEGKCLGVAEAFLSARPCETPLKPGGKIAVAIDVPEGVGEVEAWPVTFGVPFAAGALWDASGLRLVNKAGREIPSQAEVTGRWAPEGAVKWVRFDALVDSREGCFVEVAAPGAGAKPATPVAVTERGGKVVLDTGTNRYVLGKGVSPVEEVWLGTQRVACSAGTRGLYVVDQKDRLAIASAEEESMEVEASGPVAACVRFEGFYRTGQGEPVARHITRVEGFAGQPSAKVTHTLILTRSTNEVWFKEIGWELAAEPGTDPRAVFNVSRDQPQRTVSQSFSDGVVSAYMLQEDGLRMGIRPRTRRSVMWVAEPRGTNRCSVVATGGKQATAAIFEGEEIGDWASLAGGNAALVVSCRDAARQHPKEFEATSDKIVLRLFSNRGGQELDFRTETLMKKWGVSVLEPDWITPERVVAVCKLPSDAIGWSKTHELMFAALPAEGLERAAARLSELDRRRVYAHVDPWWIYRTEVLGPLYPKDPKRFPVAEKVIEGLFQDHQASSPKEVYRGFVDYCAGPHCVHYNRWRLTYTFLSDAWLLYARSGDRSIRELAEGANRAFMDNCVAHWDGPRKERGLFICAGPGVLPGTGAGAFPLYWESYRVFSLATTSNLNRSMADYYLTGYRRAKDITLQFAEAMKRHWKPSLRSGRSILTVRLLLQAYGFTWDPYLRALAEATITRSVYDSEGEVLLKKRGYGSTTYKTRTDQDVFVEAWNLIGGRRNYDIAMKLGRCHWNRSGVTGRSTGIMANFLYRETQSPSIAEGLDHFMRELSANYYDPETGYGRRWRKGRPSWSLCARVFQGLPAAMDVMARSGADRKRLVPWIDFAHDMESPVSVFVLKGEDEALDLMVRGSFLMGETPVGVRVDLGGAVRLVAHAVGNTEWAGKDLHQVRHISGGVTHVRIPKDAPGGVYEVVMRDPVSKLTRVTEQRHIVRYAGKAAKMVLAGSRVPMVFHARGSWQPVALLPAPRGYFTVPEGSAGAEISFEGSARLFTPTGAQFREGKVLTGSVKLPADQPGLWSFETVKPGAVRGRGFPPYFAMDDPAFYFEPEPLMSRQAAKFGADRELRVEAEDFDKQHGVKVLTLDGASGKKAVEMTSKGCFIEKALDLPAGNYQIAIRGRAYATPSNDAVSVLVDGAQPRGCHFSHRAWQEKRVFVLIARSGIHRIRIGCTELKLKARVDHVSISLRRY